MQNTISFAPKKKELEYPCLRLYLGDNQERVKPEKSFVVLFTSEKSGFVVWSNRATKKLGYNGDWIPATDKETWEEFKGEITLKNP